MTGEGRALRIVVAEDEAVIRMDLSEMLAEEGYEVVGQAPDGLRALELVSERHPDVLLVDVAMPGLDGIEVTREVSDRTAVIVVTAFGQRERVAQARDAGAMAYLVKPVDRRDLMPAIEMASRGWQTLNDLRGRAQSAEEAADLAADAVQGLQRRLEDRRDVERAKGLLQERLGLGEEAAYSWLRQTAMDRRMSLADLARGILSGDVPS